MRTLAAFGIGLILILPGSAHAQEGEQRYQLQRTDNGYARIDTRTGEISTCTERGDQLVCRMAADERTALMEEIAALEQRVAALETSGVGRALPTDEEVDRAVGIMERMMRGFLGIVREEGAN